jgi:hypothetical protein
VAQLATAADLQRYARRLEPEAQFQHAGMDLDGVGEAEVGTHVGGGHHRAGALRHRRAGQLEAGVHVRRTVIDSREQMEVKVGVWHRTCSIGAARADPVTLL